MIFGLKAKLLAGAIAVTAVFGAGWTAKGWLEDSRDLAAQKAREALAAQVREDFAGHSRNVEDRLSKLRANERIIDRGIIREVEKPVFRNVCIPPDGDAFRMLGLYAAGAPPGEPDDQVPAGPADAD